MIGYDGVFRKSGLLAVIAMSWLLAGFLLPVNSSAAEGRTESVMTLTAQDKDKDSRMPAKKPEQSEEDEYSDYIGEEGEEAQGAPLQIADPIESINRAMFAFNDRLYFWVLKPLARSYSRIIPERGRVSVQNFFTNLQYPIRLASCLLQADFTGAANETSRVVINTVWGVGGFLDPSSSRKLQIPLQNVDIGQTLGAYGIGMGFYIVFPVLGSSSARDAVGMVGDGFLYPVHYLSPWYAPWGVRAYKEVNDTSLRIGDYESLKEAAVDPYLAVRDVYVQYRRKMVEAAKARARAPYQPAVGEKLFAPPELTTVGETGLRTAIGYWRFQDRLKKDDEFSLRQNRCYSEMGYGSHDTWSIYGRLGVADLKITGVFLPGGPLTEVSDDDLEDEWNLFGTIGVRGIYHLTRFFGFGAYFEGSYSFGDFDQTVTGRSLTGPFHFRLTAKHLWEINMGFSARTTSRRGIKFEVGPHFHYAQAKLHPSAYVVGMPVTADMTLDNDRKIGGFATVEIPFYKGFSLTLEGRYAERFSGGMAVTFDY